MFKKQSDSPATAKAEPADSVQQARTQARHRLIGAIVLLAVGIIGFPLVFETQPRPVPVDIPIEIPRRDAMPPLVMPSAPALARRGEAIDESPAAAGRGVTPVTPAPVAAAASAVAPPARPASVTAAEPARRVSAASSPSAARAAAASVPRPSDDGERARALLEGRPATAAAESQRFVLQVGAFADAEAAREARKQVEKLGLKTYTQVAQTPGGSRIRVRVGPFVNRAEADAALAKAKASGLSAVVLTL